MSLDALFRGIIAWRMPIVLAYALIVPPALVLALRVPHDHRIDHMIVATDPDVVEARAFHRVFPGRPTLLLLAESADPFTPRAVAAVQALESAVARVPRVTAASPVSLAGRLRPDLLAPHREADLAAFLRSATFFRRQALAGDTFIGVVAVLDVGDPSARDQALDAIAQAVETFERHTGPAAGITRVRRVGASLIDSYIERHTRVSNAQYLPLFGLFVVGLSYGLYRSWRAVAAILVTVGVTVVLGMATAGVLGFTFSIVASLVPLTLLITATASLVYIHSRFVDRPPGVPVDEHQVFALRNKWPAVTVSLVAAAIGFAALGVSEIRPIRELGIWTAAGLALTWLVAFTLFPALQKLLATPTRQERALAGQWVLGASDVIPRWSYRWRWLLVPGALALCAAGGVALAGLPGLVAPMPIETDPLDYLSPGFTVYDDARWFEDHVAGLTSFSIWVRAADGAAVDPQVLSGLDRFATELEAAPEIGGVVGVTTFLRARRAAAHLGEHLPGDDAGMASVAASLEQLLLTEPALREFVDVTTLGSLRLNVLVSPGSSHSPQALRPIIDRAWASATMAYPALRSASATLTGQGLLATTIGDNLVPTLVHSFVLTAVVIFLMFLVVFRSGAARMLAMLPSLFAILVMFLVMRVAGIPLNVATILIATTVLGASENDQVHFFYHFQERRRTASTEQALGHAIRVAGSAIFFATLVNAGGFLALALSDLPPMRQFGVLTSTAFVLSMVADFTALPAALWIVFRERPDGHAGGD